MSRPFALILFILVCVFAPASAQNQPAVTPPDYRVQALGYDVDETGETIIVRFGVCNIGGPASTPVTIHLSDFRTGSDIGSTRIRPLGGGGECDSESTLSFSMRAFASGSQQNLEVWIDASELQPPEAVEGAANNSVSILVNIPEYGTTPNQSDGSPRTAPQDDSVIVLPLLNLEVDTSDPEQAAILAGIVCSGAIMLFIVVLILRLMFRRTPSFGSWQPPYATMPPLDPNSIYGRRQMWQPHALNNVVPHPCKMGSVHARKLLLGMDNFYLSGWRVLALRMTQYDMYGRVSRSQVLASGRSVARLDRITRRLDKLDAAKLARRVRPVARRLARQLKKKINKRNAMLPVALDIRFQGTHGEVRILFELYECQRGQPALLDSWEPEMTVIGKRIYESYTFTVYGQTGGETLKDFRRRLSGDIERLLVDFLRTGLVTTSTPAPEISPDTLHNMQPVNQPAVDVPRIEPQERL